MQRPSVLFLNRVCPPARGATGRVLRDLARAMARDGWKVTVITSGAKAGVEQDAGVKIIRLKGSQKPRGIFGYAWIWLKMFSAAMRLPRRDLVVSMTDPPMLAVLGGMIARRKKAKHIHWCQDLYPDLLPVLGCKLPKKLMTFLEKRMRRALKSADRIMVIGRCMAKHLTHYAVDQGRMTVIPNWPDPELDVAFEQENTYGPLFDMEGVRPFEKQHKTSPKFRVLYAGTIGLAHPIEIVLGAAKIFNASHPDIEFVFVGDGKGFDDLARERSRRSLGNIRFMPYQPAERLRYTMESGDVHLISMKHEACGMLVPCKLYSALAVHRPCIFIGHEDSESARTISDFGAGTVVSSGDANDLVRAITAYRTDSDAWFAAHNGAAEAAKIFTSKDAIAAWVKRARQLVE